MRLYCILFCSPELAGGLDGLAEWPGVGLGLEDVGDEGVLRGVHDERAVRHVLADAEERQKPEMKKVNLMEKFSTICHGEGKFVGCVNPDSWSQVVSSRNLVETTLFSRSFLSHALAKLNMTD